MHFPAGTNLGDAWRPTRPTRSGPPCPQLLSGVDLSMVNFESALTDGTCPDPSPSSTSSTRRQSAVSAFKGAGVTLITEANNHGEDCGAAGLQTALATRAQTGYTILGIGQNAAQAFTPYTTTIHGEHIAIIAATQVIDSDLQSAWTATATQPGLASAYDVNDLVAAVEAARKTADTVIVYLHWGTELDACPNPLQEPLAQVLVQAGADIVVGTHAHVLLGRGLSRARPTSTTASATSPSTTTPHPRTPAAHWSSRPPAATSTSHLAARRHRERPAPAARGRRGDRRTGRLEPGPRLHQRHRRARGRRSPRRNHETSPAPAVGGAAALGRLGLRHRPPSGSANR